MNTRRGGRLSWAMVAALGAAVPAGAAEPAPPSPAPLVFVSGTALPAGLEYQVAVDQDLGQPDMATLRLGGAAGRAFGARVPLGAALSVTGAGRSLFKGEVVAIEPVCDAPDTVEIRGLNRLHRLAHAAHTRTFFDATDDEVFRTVAAEHGLAAAGAGLRQRYEAIYQDNQTDLEFLRARAARHGFAVWVEDTKLVAGRAGDAGTVRPATFHARLSSSATVQRVVVRGWDPQRREPFVGQAVSPGIVIGEGAGGGDRGATEEFTVDHPIFSVEEAAALAGATLEARRAEAAAAEVALDGVVAIRAGQTIEISGAGDPFDGKYLVQGVTHKYGDPAGGSGYGATTALKLRRADGGLFFLPEVDDEVLVAFAHGDVRAPYVVGSLWDGGAPAACATEDPHPH